MRKFLYSSGIIITALFLYGFVAGVEIGDPDDVQLSEPNSPVLEYEETIVVPKTNQELYNQYHLLAISSLEEAQTSFQENKLWTYRMVHNASNYIKLMHALALDEYKQEYTTILESLKPLIADLKNSSKHKYQTAQIKHQLKNIEKELEQDYSWEKVKAWIKD
ncbi:MAG: hypothetical protein KJ915_04775 [Candidatus Omnitrophica bacterium]|nr:hypothetical protein [Candidatus Omnitrophota bacterium]